MNKKELIEAIASRTKLTEVQAKDALNAFVDVIADELKKGEKVQITGFGTFETSTREAREGRNPATGEKMEISEAKKPKFKAGKTLKDSLN